MYRRLLVLLLLAWCASAQAQSSHSILIDSTVHSIIVKFRTAAALGDAATLSKLRAVSASPTIYRQVFKRPAKGAGLQGINSASTLDRIVQIPLRSDLNAQDAVRQLARVPEFEYVEPNYRYHIQADRSPKSLVLSPKSNQMDTQHSALSTEDFAPNDPLFFAQWWLTNVHAPEAWQITEGDSTVKIGFVDTGVDWLHPDLKFQFAVNPAEDINHNGLFDAWPDTVKGVDARGDTVYGDIDGKDHDGNGYANDVIGYNFVDQEQINTGDWFGRDPFPVDEHGHGTVVAGILAAQQNNGIGVSGIAPKCKLVALKAFDANGTGEDDDIASAIVYAADNGVRVLNCSFGDIIPSLLQRDAIRYAIAKGVAVFGSSGNDGTDGPNYPAEFDEVVSVGGTTSYPSPDNLYAFTTHSEELDVVAPAEYVLTTAKGGSYDSVSGTSAASPIAAGIAALLLSKDPRLSPVELRSIIESTTKDVGDRGYDHRSANGRIDALAALTYKGGANIKLTSPHRLDEFRIGDTIHLTGSAISTLFTGYSVDWAYGMRPDTNPSVNNWHNIASGTSQVLDTTFGVWNTAGLRPGYYTVRLAVRSSDNRSTEEHCIIALAAAPPKFVLFSIDSLWINNQRGLLVQATSDIPTQLEVHYAAQGAKPSTIANDKIGFEHIALIKREAAQAGVPLAIAAILRTPDGNTTIIDTTAIIPDDAVPQDGFVEKPYTLPGGFALDTTLMLPTGDEAIENPNESGILTVFRFDSTKRRFIAIDSLDDPAIPRALGNSQGDNRPELLVQSIDTCFFPFTYDTTYDSLGMHIRGSGGSQSCGVTRVYKANGKHSILGGIIYQNDTLYGSTFAALEANHAQDVIGTLGDSCVAYKYDAGRYIKLGSMINPSTPDYYNSQNTYSWPNVVHADLRGNGFDDLVTLDDDADLIVYERDATAPTGFRAVFTDENDGASSGSLVTVGDFDGDGKPDIAFAYHPIFQQDTLDEYHAAYWTVKVLRNLGGMKFAPMYVEHFWGSNQNDHFYINSDRNCSLSRVTNVTGHSVDDLVLSLFPNFYLIEYDSSSHAMKPVWQYPLSTSPHGALAWDFDRNGKREFGFFAGDSIRFFERSNSYLTQTPSPAGFMVSPRDTDRVDLEWAPVEKATKYLILRALPTDRTYTVIDSTTSSRYTDSTVANGDVLIYSVAAVSPAYSTPISLPAFGFEVIVHPMPQLDSAQYSSEQSLLAHSTNGIRTPRIWAGTIMVDDTILPNAIAIVGPNKLVLSLQAPLAVGSHKLRVTSFDLRDTLNSPFDTVHYLVFNVSHVVTLDRFYIVSWTFDQGPNGLRIHVIFNEQPSSDALDVSHYSLSPYGTLTNVSIDSANPNALYIDVAGNIHLAGLGVPFVLCINGITSTR